MDIEWTKKVYNRLVDEESKKIFTNRLLYSITEENKYLKKIIQPISYDENKEYVIFGAGYWGAKIYELYPEIPWKCFCDNYSENTNYCSIPVIKLLEICEKYHDAYIVIASRNGNQEIEKQLLKEKFRKEQILNWGKIEDTLQNNIYFDCPYMMVDDNEIFVDAGCFDGASTHEFINWCGGNYKKIYAFEPDDKNFLMCKKELESIKNCNIINAGLASEKGYVKFRALGSVNSVIDEFGDSQVRVEEMDECIPDERVTFIKMDIEGSEREALMGAENIIRQYKPKLAISVYHKREDIIDIPMLILQYSDTYQFALRHYTLGEFDTVLYAFNIAGEGSL